MPGESHGQRSLAGHGPWDHRESDSTEGTKPAAAAPFWIAVPAERLAVNPMGIHLCVICCFSLAALIIFFFEINFELTQYIFALSLLLLFFSKTYTNENFISSLI